MEQNEQDVTQDEAPEAEVLEDKGVYGPTSFTELDEVQSAQETRVKVMTLTDQFLSIVNNIMYEPEIEDKGTAVMSLAGEFAARVKANAQKEMEVEDYWALDDTKAKWSTSLINSLPDSSFLYIESGGKKDAEGKTKPRSLRHLPYKTKAGKIDLPHVRNAISRLSQSGTGTAGGETWLTKDLRSRLLSKARRILKQETKGLGVWDHIKAFFGFEDEAPLQEESSFTVWKEGDTTYWLAIYSNNYRDSDNPPEILAAQSHKEFVDAVDKGTWPHPELWLWHVRGSTWGKTIQLAYDEATGFTIAVGEVDKGKEHIAEALSKMSDIRVSHGMPSTLIERDKEDPTVITRYRTREISPLPAKAAANKATGFHILKETDDMLPEHKKAFLADLGVDVDALEANLLARKEELDAAGVESKEETPAEETPQPEDTKEEPSTEEAPAEETSTADFVAQMADAITLAVETAVAPLTEEIAGLKESQEALEAKQTKQDEDFLGMTPAQSLADLVAASVIGKTETKLDGRSSEAKDGPKETEPESNVKGVGIPFIDAMRQGKDWRETFPAAD